MNATSRARLLSVVSVFATLALPPWNVAAQPAGTPPTAIDIATAYPEGNFHVVNLQQFAREVEAATGGAVTVKVHPGGTLAKAPDIRKAVVEGRIAAGEVFGPSLTSLHGVFGLDGIPFFATNYAAARKLWKASETMATSKLAAEGLTLLMSVPWPPQGLFAAKPLATPKDLAGLWMRENSPPVARLAELIDAKPVRVETPELAAAASQGKLDLVFTSAAQGLDTKLAQSLKYYYLANAWLPRNVVFINTKALSALPKAQQQTILDLAKRAENRGWAASEAFAESSTKALQQAGAIVSLLPAEVKSRLERMGIQIASEVLKSGDPELWALAAKALL